MATIPLKPQYGPTLGRLLTPRWNAAPRAMRGVVIAAGCGLVVLAVAVTFTLLPAKFSYGGAAPVSLQLPGSLPHGAPSPARSCGSSVAPDGRLEDSYAVSSLRLPPYAGGVSGELPVYASGYIGSLRRKFSGFVLRGEGKTRVNTVPAYDVLYTATVEGREMYGRDVLLLPERTGARDGVAIEMLSRPSAKVTSPLEVGTEGVLEKPLKTFTFS